MSVINKDQQVVNEGRRAPLKDAEAPLRDQIAQKLYDKVVELMVGEKVDELWRQGNADRNESLKRQQAYLDHIDDFTLPDTEGPYSGSSQVHLPIAFTIVKTFHARMSQAVMGVDPPFFTKARNVRSRDRVQMVSDTLRYFVADGANYGKGIEEVVDRWLWDWIAGGIGYKKWRWDVRYARYVDVVEVPEKQPSDFAPHPQTGQIVEIPRLKLVEKEVPVTKKCFEGPVCELVNYEDIVTVGDGDPDLADAVLHRQFMTASDLWTLADRKIFKADVVEEIIRGGPTNIESSLASDIKSQRKRNAGLAQVQSTNDLDRYEIVEAYLRMDVDGSGINSDIIVWVHLQSRKILRATYLYRVSKAGERPFAKILFQPRKGQESAAGLVELVYPLCQEIDAIHNMRVDWGILSVMPFGFYKASSSIDPKTIQLEPGCLIPMDNPQTDVYFPNLGNRTVFGFQEEQSLYTAIERLTSISDLNLGVIGGQGATRTATGSRALVGEMSSNLDVYLKRLNRGWKKSLRTLLHMLQQRIPAGTSFRLTGDDGQDYWREIKDARDLEGDFDIEVLPNSQSSNQQIQVDTAMQILQTTANPLDIQLGVVGPLERYEALKNYYQAMGIKDWGRYLSKVDPALAAVKLTPLEEADLVLGGTYVPVAPQADHKGFIEFVQMFLKDEYLNGQLKPQHIVLLQAQAKKHQQMQDALDANAAQQANTTQMRTNAAQSSQQAPVGLPTQGMGGMPSQPSPIPG